MAPKILTLCLDTRFLDKESDTHASRYVQIILEGNFIMYLTINKSFSPAELR